MSIASRRPFLLRRLLTVVLTGVAVCCFSGCLIFESIIKVNPDGSGTVEQVFIATNPMLRMALLFGSEDGEEASLCKEEDLRKEAAAMGEGVRLASFEAVDEEEALGCRAVYAFDDINTLHVTLDPESQMPGGMTDDAATDEAQAEDSNFLTFRFKRGAPSTLTVMLKQDFEGRQNTEDEENLDAEQRAQQLQMMREMLKGGRFYIALDIQGAITETNATYRDANTVTLLEVDFDEVLKNDAQLELLMDANPTSADEVKDLVQQIDGMKVETLEEFQVRF